MNLQKTFISKPLEEKFSMRDKLTAKSDSQGAMEELPASGDDVTAIMLSALGQELGHP